MIAKACETNRLRVLLHQRDRMMLDAAVARMVIQFFRVLVVLIQQCVLLLLMLTLDYD